MSAGRLRSMGMRRGTATLDADDDDDADDNDDDDVGVDDKPEVDGGRRTSDRGQRWPRRRRRRGDGHRLPRTPLQGESLQVRVSGGRADVSVATSSARQRQPLCRRGGVYLHR